MSRAAVTTCLALVLAVMALGGASSASANWTTNGNATGSTFTASAGAPPRWAIDPAGPSSLVFVYTGGAIDGKLLAPPRSAASPSPRSSHRSPHAAASSA